MLQQEIKTLSKTASTVGLLNIIGIVISFVVGILITRIVGASILGSITIGLSVLGVLRVFATLGLDKGALRYISFYRGKRDLNAMRTTVWITTGTVVLSSILLILIYKLWLYSRLKFVFPEIPHIDDIFQIFIYLLPIIVLNEVLNNLLTGIEKPHYVQGIQKILLPVSRFLLLLVFLYFYTKLNAFLFATFFSQILTTLALIFLFLKLFRKLEFPSNIAKNSFNLKQFILFSLPLTLIPVFNLATQQVDTLIVGHFMTSVDTGVYAIVRRVGALVLIPLSMVGGIFSAQASRMFAQKKNQDIKDLYLFSTKWIFTLSAFIFLIFYLESDLILKLFGKEFIAGSTALKIFAFGQLLNASFGPSGNLLLMIDKTKLVLLNSLVSAILGILLAYFLIKDFGLVGATAAMAATIITVNLLAMLQLYFLVGVVPCSINIFIKRISITLGCGYLTTVIFKYLSEMGALFHICISSLVVIIVFPILLYITEGFSKNDKMILSLIGSKFKR